MMPFQHVAVPQDEKPQLYHWLRFASLAHSPSFFFFFFSAAVASLTFFFQAQIQEDKDGRKEGKAKETEKGHWRMKESGEGATVGVWGGWWVNWMVKWGSRGES